QANSVILNRLDELSDKYNLVYRSAKIISARKKWGSCDNLRDININFRLVMLSPECIDYVLIHELCHTIYMNHSIKFWREVEKFVPNYEEIKQIIKQNSFTLELF
ncbi:MAG: M48 family metallopeptidase, partial [Clostridia bacterium]|nr:M48 family metallopeptidase [Clostridia bacterium]